MSSSQQLTPFHLALPVQSLDQVSFFYCDLLGGSLGRFTSRWIDVNLYGHQLSFHLHPQCTRFEAAQSVDGDSIGVPHFGVVLKWEHWIHLVEHLKQHSVSFVVTPKIRFKGTSGEQGTFFIRDPQGYLLEFKSFQDFNYIFQMNQKEEAYD